MSTLTITAADLPDATNLACDKCGGRPKMEVAPARLWGLAGDVTTGDAAQVTSWRCAECFAGHDPVGAAKRAVDEVLALRWPAARAVCKRGTTTTGAPMVAVKVAAPDEDTARWAMVCVGGVMEDLGYVQFAQWSVDGGELGEFRPW